MCINTRYIYNRYIKKDVLVNCGKCEACLQVKADARAARIRNTSCAKGTITLFVTLTYSNEYVPYIDTRGLIFGENYNVPIFRSYSGRYSRYSQDYKTRYRAFKSIKPLDYISRLNLPKSSFYSNNPCRILSLVGRPSYQVGVLYYKDVQDFIKRLRINLQRNYNIVDENFRYFSCSEYGSTTNRPHFHLLLTISSNFEPAYRYCILKSWPYADKSRTNAGIETARDASGYVSSYVNGHRTLPEILKTEEIRSKHSYSHDYGMANPAFSLSSVLDKADRQDMSFYCRRTIKGISSISHLPLPKYVISRYFPLFKGYSRLSVDSLYELLQRPETIRDSNIIRHTAEFRDIGYRDNTYIDLFGRKIWSDTYQIYVRLENSYQRYYTLTGKTRYDYAIDYVRVWNSYHSTLLRMSFSDLLTLNDYYQHYDNLTYGDDNHALRNLCNQTGLLYDSFHRDPNTSVRRKAETSLLTSRYLFKEKTKKVNSYLYSKEGFYV